MIGEEVVVYENALVYIILSSGTGMDFPTPLLAAAVLCGTRMTNLIKT